MPIATRCRWLNLDLDQSEDAIDISQENFTVHNHRHAPDRKETLSSIFVVGQLDIVNYTSDGILQESAVPCEHMLYMLIHDWHKFDTFFLDKRASSFIIQLGYVLHDGRSLVLKESQ